MVGHADDRTEQSIASLDSRVQVADGLEEICQPRIATCDRLVPGERTDQSKGQKDTEEPLSEPRPLQLLPGSWRAPCRVRSPRPSGITTANPRDEPSDDAAANRTCPECCREGCLQDNGVSVCGDGDPRTTSKLTDSVPGLAIRTTSSRRETGGGDDNRSDHSACSEADPQLAQVTVPNAVDPGFSVEDRGDDDDSAISEGFSSFSSLPSEVLNYEWTFGRSYQSYRAGRYWFPNDETEQERLDLVHNALLYALDDRLILAPIHDSCIRILDVGTGTGIWAMHVADTHGGAEVCGNDLSPIQPKLVPPNVEFFIDDVEEEWTDRPFELIHCRDLSGAIEDWPRFVNRIYDNLIPGGWIELQGFVNMVYSERGELPVDDPLVRLMAALQEAGDLNHREMNPVPKFKNWMNAAGFQEVKQERVKIPIGVWPKDENLRSVGHLMAESYRLGIGGVTAVPCREKLGWSAAAVEVFNYEVRTAVYRTDTRYFLEFISVIGQKPD